MIRYVALLRGINVGGRRLIKMDELARICSGAGLRNVRTFIASGNVIFESASGNKAALTRKIEKALAAALGYEVTVILRTVESLAALVQQNPFRGRPQGKDVMQFVVFLAAEPQDKIKIPLISTTEKFEVFALIDGAAFILSRRKKTGWFGFPNNFVEKQFRVAGTTRNWSTVNKILKAAEL